MVKVVKGSKESIIVDIVDKLNSIVTLDGLALTFDVLDSEGNLKYTDEPATSTDMRMYCLIDTATWDVGRYKLFAMIETGDGEKPRLGPFEIQVV